MQFFMQVKNILTNSEYIYTILTWRDVILTLSGQLVVYLSQAIYVKTALKLLKIAIDTHVMDIAMFTLLVIVK